MDTRFIKSRKPKPTLSSEAILQFKKIYFQENNILLSDDEAKELGLKLLRLFKQIYKPINISYGK